MTTSPAAATDRDIVDLAGATLSALGVMVALGSQVPIQLDEAFARDLAGLPWGELWAQFATTETNAAGWHLILAVWVRMFSDPGTLVLRIPAIVCTAGMVPAVWALARRLHGLSAARRAAWLVAAHPLVFRFGWEARGYAAVMLVSALLLLLWHTNPSPWIFGLAAGASIWLHVLVPLVAVALVLTRLHAAWRVAAGSLPLAAIPLWWMWNVERDVLWWLEFPTPLQWTTGLVLLLGGLGAIGYLVGLGRQASTLQLATAVPIVSLAVATLVWQPLWQLRYLAVAVPPLLVSVGSLRIRWAGLTALGGVASWILLLWVPADAVPSTLGPVP